MDRCRRVGAPLLGLAASVALFAGSRGLDGVAREGQLGPGFWPRLVLAGLAIACLAKVAEAWRGRGAGGEARPELSRARLAAGIALIVAYVVAVPVVGFPLTTAGFIAGFMILAGARAPAGIAAAAVVGTVSLLYLFVKAVYLPLPKGDLVFEAFTLAVYRALRIF
jgi:putative tricarboxylic transport membrane protein